MEFGFWKGLKKPFFAIAPMADVTDIAFREIIAKYGAPDVFWTEFVSCDGLCSRGKEKLLIDLKFTKKQKPIVAQFFGATPKHFYECALLAGELGFDGIDINMGCPDRAVEKQGASAALMKNPKLAQEIIKETKRGAESAGRRIPVSVKTRLGYNKDMMEDWLPYIFEMEPAVITVHGRTRKEMSKVPAHWDRIADAVSLRDGYFSDAKEKLLIIGNGDVSSVEDGIEKAKGSGVDGIMVGRGIFGNPFFFADLSRSAGWRRGKQIEHPALISPESNFIFKDKKKNNKKKATQSRNSAERSECVANEIECEISAGLRQQMIEKRLSVMVEHTRLFEKYFGNSNIDRSTSLKNFDNMKKHFKAYVSGFDNAKELRMKLMNTKSADEVESVLKKYNYL